MPGVRITIKSDETRVTNRINPHTTLQAIPNTQPAAVPPPVVENLATQSVIRKGAIEAGKWLIAVLLLNMVSTSALDRVLAY